MVWKVVEKANPLHVHAICGSREGAERWIAELAPVYCERGFFVDKTLTPDSFTIKNPKEKQS